MKVKGRSKPGQWLPAAARCRRQGCLERLAVAAPVVLQLMLKQSCCPSNAGSQRSAHGRGHGWLCWDGQGTLPPMGRFDFSIGETQTKINFPQKELCALLH